MINKKIAMSALSIVTALALAGGATYAFFTSQATSTSNVFASGDLILSFNDETNVQSTTNSIGGTDMAPGDCTGNATVNLYNNGSINGTSIAVAASNTNGSMSPFLKINNFTIGGNPVTVTEFNGNGYTDLQDLANNGATGGGINAGSSTNLVMDVCLDTTAGNDLQGASNDVSFTFTLNQ